MLSNCGHDEYYDLTGGKAGDQTGSEWEIVEWYSRPWNYMLRHPSDAVRREIAVLARLAARNNLIGYDQGQRITFWNHLKASDYDPAKITIACEADCSSAVAGIVKAVGYRLNLEPLKQINENAYTGNLRLALRNAGFQVYSDTKYLNSSKDLYQGDILLYEYHHTAINLDNGSNVNGPGSIPDQGGGTDTSSGQRNVEKGQRWLNSNYGGLIIRSVGALLDADNDYGTKSRAAALAVWKDVVNRFHGFSLTPSNTNFGVLSKAAASKALVRKGDNGTLVYLVQFILAANHLYSGPMDASFGDGTYSGVVAFQKKHGLSADGIVGGNTWERLFNTR